MSKQILQNIVTIRALLKNCTYQEGEINGILNVTVENLLLLKSLAAASAIESQVIKDGRSIELNKINLTEGENFEISLTVYTRQVKGSIYFEDLDELIRLYQGSYPAGLFYLHSFCFFSDEEILPEKIKQLKQINGFIDMLKSISDYVKVEIGEPDSLIFFEKRKLTIPIIYNENIVDGIPFLNEFIDELTNAHDKIERQSIFITELIAYLSDTPESERFANLLMNLKTIRENYLKSHLLYLEKFSYHDLKAQVDNDKFEYTKKIYSTVNDVQTKIVAVPAAYLIVLSQFDFTGVSNNRNIFICIGCFLFSILLEVLLRNQFGVIGYIQKEIIFIQNKLSNKDASLDINEFVISFNDLTPVINKQKCYLWIFRVITWSVPISALVMYYLFKP